MKDTKPAPSFGLNGRWSSILYGAYRKKPNFKQIKCPVCAQKFRNNGNLANHIEAKHKKYRAEKQAKLTFTTPYPIEELVIGPKLMPNTPSKAPPQIVSPKTPEIEATEASKSIYVPNTPANKSSRNNRTNLHKKKLIEGYEKCKTHKEKELFREKNNFTVNNMKKWKQKRKQIEKDSQSWSNKRKRISSAVVEVRKKAKYEEEEKALHKKYKARRAIGLPVDCHWLKNKMKEEVKNSGKDPEKTFKGSDKWLSGFIKRKGISHQRKTNKKSKSVEERLPQIRNFHWWAIYKMATEDP